MFANAPAELCNFDMFRVDRVGIQRRSIGKNCDEPGIVRSWQVQHVKSYGETLNLGYEVLESIQQFYMFVPFELGDISAVLPNNKYVSTSLVLVHSQKLKCTTEVHKRPLLDRERLRKNFRLFSFLREPVSTP